MTLITGITFLFQIKKVGKALNFNSFNEDFSFFQRKLKAFRLKKKEFSTTFIILDSEYSGINLKAFGRKEKTINDDNLFDVAGVGVWI